MADGGAEDDLTTPQAAAYLGMARHALRIAAERSEIGRKRPVRGRTPPSVWVFTLPELAAWKARVQNRGGRPTSGVLIVTPALRM